jgi:RND family efflux transporter MFP subunit
MNFRTLCGACAAPLFLISIALSARPVRELPGEYGGRIEPSRVVLVSASADGRLESCAVDRGDLVEAGQELARMDDQLEALTVRATELRATRDSGLVAATAEIAQLTCRIEKRAALYADGTLVGAELDDLRDKREMVGIGLRRAEEDRAEALLDLERAQALLERTRVRAPIRGVVLQRLASPGEYISRSNGSAVFKIAALDPLEVEVHVPPGRAAALRVGGQAEVRPEATELVYRATVKQVDKVVDTASGTSAVRLVLENPSLAIAAGLRCKVHFVD